MRRAPTEHQEQAAFIAWMRAQHRDLLAFAVPNGAHLAGTQGQRAAQMTRLKREGLVPGVPDVFVPALNLWIEMKAAGGRVSADQRWIHDCLRLAGCHVEVCFGADAAMAAVTRHINEAVGRLANPMSESERPFDISEFSGRVGAAGEGASNTRPGLTVNRPQEAILAAHEIIPGGGILPPQTLPKGEQALSGFEPIGAVAARLAARAVYRDDPDAAADTHEVSE